MNRGAKHFTASVKDYQKAITTKNGNKHFVNKADPLETVENHPKENIHCRLSKVNSLNPLRDNYMKRESLDKNNT